MGTTLLVGDSWNRLQEHSDEFSPGWALLKSDTLGPTGSYSALNVAWHEGLLVAGAYEQSLALYIAEARLFVNADSRGLPTTLIGPDTELVPVACAEGVVLLTTARVIGRLARGYFVKTAIEPSREFIFALQRDQLVWAEADADVNWRGPGRVVLIARGGSGGAVCLSLTHMINRYADAPDHRFVSVGTRHFCEALGFERHLGERVKTRSGTVRSLALDPSLEIRSFATRVRTALAQPWLTLP